MNDPKLGRTATRALKSLCVADGDHAGAMAYASAQNWLDQNQIVGRIKAGIPGMIAAGDALSSGIDGSDLLDLVRPREIISKLVAARRVPFGIRLNTQTGGSSSNWTGEGRPAPLSKLNFANSVFLERKTITSLSVITEELVRSASLDAEATISRDMSASIVAATDSALVDGLAGTSARPASVTYNAPSFSSSGSTYSALDSDLGKLIESLLAANSTLENAVWIMAPATASFIGRMRGTNGDVSFPGISVAGGVLAGLPVITSASVSHGGSPPSSSIVLLDASRLWVADSNSLRFETSRYSAMQMLDNATNDSAAPTATSMVSMLQTGSVALRSTRELNWQLAETGSCAVLNGVSF